VVEQLEVVDAQRALRQAEIVDAVGQRLLLTLAEVLQSGAASVEEPRQRL
jgi:hypothetical protein